ncbi:ATP-binding cassette domain-containing protein, partial [Klebsiella pneumoniae]|uniref:ATP-binding cassette domain-containing protein n=1 Tax=Klebsiella pneumoniae TaxID=573 RepID=UPI0013A5AB71
GKSTTLHIITKLKDISNNHLKINDKIINKHNPKQHNITIVFQNYTIYPHITIHQNINFELYTSKLSKTKKNKHIKETNKTLKLKPYL